MASIQSLSFYIPARTQGDNSCNNHIYALEKCNTIETTADWKHLNSSRIGAVTTEFDYDNYGNMTVEDASGTKTTYAYDRENRMQTMQTASGISTYAYDGDGLRRRIQDGSGTVTIVWDGTDYLQERT